MTLQLQDYPSHGFCIIISSKDNWYRIEGRYYLLAIQALKANLLRIEEQDKNLVLIYSDSNAHFQISNTKAMSKSEIKQHSRQLYDFMQKSSFHIHQQSKSESDLMHDVPLSKTQIDVESSVYSQKIIGVSSNQTAPLNHAADSRKNKLDAPLYPSNQEPASAAQDPSQTEYISSNIKFQSSAIMKDILNNIILSTLQKATHFGIFSQFRDSMTQGNLAVERGNTLTDMLSKAREMKYESVSSIIEEISQLVTNVEKCFKINQSTEWHFTLRCAKYLRAFIIAHLEAHLADHKTSDVVLAPAVQREILRLGGNYIIDSRTLSYGQDIVLRHHDQGFPLSVRIESFVKSFYFLAKNGIQFSNPSYDFNKLSIIIDASKFLSPDTFDLVPLFYSEDTSTLIVTYQNEISSDFPVYVLDLYPENPSETHQDGPISISEFLSTMQILD